MGAHRDPATVIEYGPASSAAPTGSPAGNNGPSGPGGAPRTANNGPTGTVLDVQRLAVALLAEALDTVADPVAPRAFASDGRAEIRLTRIKDLPEPYNAAPSPASPAYAPASPPASAPHAATPAPSSPPPAPGAACCWS